MGRLGWWLFALCATLLLLCGGFAYFKFNDTITKVELTAQYNGNADYAKVFFNCGEGFTDQHYVPVFLEETNNSEQQITISADTSQKNVINLRIDPLEGEGIVSISSITFYSGLIPVFTLNGNQILTGFLCNESVESYVMDNNGNLIVICSEWDPYLYGNAEFQQEFVKELASGLLRAKVYNGLIFLCIGIVLLSIAYFVLRHRSKIWLGFISFCKIFYCKILRSILSCIKMGFVVCFVNPYHKMINYFKKNEQKLLIPFAKIDGWFKRHLSIEFCFAVATVIISAIFISITIIQWNSNIVVVDPSANESALLNLLNEGRARVGPLKDTVNYVDTPIYQVYFCYLVELLLRLPFYCLYLWTGLNLFNSIAALVYYLLFSIFTIWFLIRKEQKQFILFFAVANLLIFTTRHIYECFIQMRYMSFLSMAIFFCSIYIFYTQLTLKVGIKRFLMVSFLALTPGLFHSIGFLFSAGVIVCESLYSFKTFANKGIPYLKNTSFLVKGFLLSILAALTLLGCIIGQEMIEQFLRVKTQFSLSGIKTVLTSSVANNTIGLLFAFIILISLVLRYPKLNDFNKRVVNQSVSILLIVFMISTLSSSSWRMLKYNILPYIAWVFLIAVAITIFMDIIKDRLNMKLLMNSTSAKVTVLTISVVLTIILNHSTRHIRIMYAPDNVYSAQVEKTIAEIGDENLIVLTEHTIYFFNHFPNIKTYISRDYPPIEQVNTITEKIFIRTPDNWVMGWNSGITYGGTCKDFSRILQSCSTPDTTYLYTPYMQISFLEPQLAEFFEKNSKLAEQPVLISEVISTAKMDSALKYYFK